MPTIHLTTLPYSLPLSSHIPPLPNLTFPPLSSSHPLIPLPTLTLLLCHTGNEPLGPGLPDNLTVVDMSDTYGFEADPDPQPQYSLPPIERKGTTGTGAGTGLF